MAPVIGSLGTVDDPLADLTKVVGARPTGR